MRFGRLTLVGYSHKGKGEHYWLCRCECGSEKAIGGRELRCPNGTRSCGCLHRERVREWAAGGLQAHSVPRLDLTGQRFGRWTVLGWSPNNRRGRNTGPNRWICRCECGVEREVAGASLRNGSSKSCGCLLPDLNRKRFEGHVRAERAPETREYRIWKSMKQRCTNPKRLCYPRYGGRGIKVCDRWMESFANFFADLGPSPSPDHQIDRIDNDGNYEPGNVRWATRSQQMANRRPRQKVTSRRI